MDVAPDNPPAAGEALDGEEPAGPAQKKARTARKLTANIFVEKIENHPKSHCYCKVGCLNDSLTGLFEYAVTSTATIERHCKAKHSALLDVFYAARDGQRSQVELEDLIAKAHQKAQATLDKHSKTSAKFYKQVERLPMKTRSDLVGLAWAICNGVSRNALNHPLLDKSLASRGAQPFPNRHDLENAYLPMLDLAVTRVIRKKLSLIDAVSTSTDGWKDLAKRYWLDVGLAWTDISSNIEWKLEVIDLDLVQLLTNSTADVVETLILESISSFVRLNFCLNSSLCELYC